jgi:uncharacterized protein YjiS (DUF1127 family)
VSAREGRQARAVRRIGDVARYRRNVSELRKLVARTLELLFVSRGDDEIPSSLCQRAREGES